MTTCDYCDREFICLGKHINQCSEKKAFDLRRAREQERARAQRALEKEKAALELKKKDEMLAFYAKQQAQVITTTNVTNNVVNNNLSVVYNTVIVSPTSFTEDNLVQFLSSVECLIKEKQLRGPKKIKGAIIEAVKACPNPAMKEICHYLYDGEVDLPENLPESQIKLIEYNCKHLENAYDNLVGGKELAI